VKTSGGLHLHHLVWGVVLLLVTGFLGFVGPPAHTTTDHVLTPLDILATMAAPRGITTLPACDAAIIQPALPGLVAIPLRDASPAMLSLTWRAASTNPLVDALVASARHAPEEPQVNNHVPPL